tara:strand:- start:289 stop:639 length:351 start_codon:yes stop_codon:yes gene_type:complete
MPFHLTLLPLLLVIPINEKKGNYRFVPSRSEWNKICMAKSLKDNGLKNGKSWGSSVDKTLAQSKCTCRYEYVKELRVMSFEDFSFAYQKCREEFAENHLQTFTKYLQIHLNERDKK